MTDTKMEQNDLSEVKKKIDEIENKLSPSELAKSIDSTYLSINSTRLFLQFLSAMFTVFLAGAVYFGYLGAKSIFELRDEVKKVERIRIDIEDTISQSKNDINNSTQESKSTLNLTKKIESEVKGKANNIDVEISKMKKDMYDKYNQEIGDLQQKITKLDKNLTDISSIFNKLGIEYDNILTVREKQLLFLIAQNIEPKNPIFNYNAAVMAKAFGRYDEAIKYFDNVIDSKEIPENIISQAKTMKKECYDLKSNPPSVQKKDPQGVAIGDYALMPLFVNIVETIWKNGYITYDQAQKIFDDAKMKK